MRETKKNMLEEYTEWYLNELKEAGYIKGYRREPYSFNIIPEKKLKRQKIENLKTKVKITEESFNILSRLTYKFDYEIEWDKKSEGIFYNMITDEFQRIWTPFFAMKDKEDRIVSLIDVKPPAAAKIFGNNTTGYTFPVIQKVLYHMYGIFINKAIPIPLVSKGLVKSGNKQALFTTTFTPKRYFLTDGGQQTRKINFRTKTLKDYIDYKQKELNKIKECLNQQLKIL